LKAGRVERFIRYRVTLSVMASIPEDRVRLIIYLPKTLDSALREYIEGLAGASYRGTLSFVIAQALLEFLERRGVKVETKPKIEMEKAAGER